MTNNLDDSGGVKPLVLHGLCVSETAHLIYAHDWQGLTYHGNASPDFLGWPRWKGDLHDLKITWRNQFTDGMPGFFRWWIFRSWKSFEVMKTDLSKKKTSGVWLASMMSECQRISWVFGFRRSPFWTWVIWEIHGNPDCWWKPHASRLPSWGMGQNYGTNGLTKLLSLNKLYY